LYEILTFQISEVNVIPRVKIDYIICIICLIICIESTCILSFHYDINNRF
jgi:hypothetical protein